MPHDRLLDFVNPLQGTASQHDFSQGNCLPLVCRPFGMAHWSPQTDEGNWLFDRRSRKLQGVRLTHIPSPWMGDYGHFVVMPQTGPHALDAAQWASAYRLDQSVVKPHVFQADLIRYRTTLAMTPTERGAVFRFDFPQGETGRVVFQPFEGDSLMEAQPGRAMIRGFTRGNSGGVPDNFACYFVAVFDRPFNRAVLFAGGQALPEVARQEGERVGAYAEFDALGGPLTLRVATSFIGFDQAMRNLDSEIGERSFEDIRAEGERVWGEALGQVEIEGATDVQRRTFYTCLYRANLFPRQFHEYDGAGRPVHYSPYDGQMHDGVLYTDNGFWDTYRSVYSLLSILYPERWGDIIRGWAEGARESGWFPRWPSPGHRACMIGTHIDAVMADAVAKGFRDFDQEAAYALLRRNAFEAPGVHAPFGRREVDDYQRLGYVPAEAGAESPASATMDYAYNDWCLAQIAQALGREDDARTLRERAFNYRHVYDRGVGFMRGRRRDGSWLEPWREFGWGGAYVEGGPWQSSWAVPHDPAGLIALMGGPDAFVAKLDRMFTLPPSFEAGSYGFEIHEMTEMAMAEFGQYAQSNQPVHHVLTLFSCAGRPWKNEYWTRRVLDDLYTPDVLPGDEDNGEMASWYVLNALGLYPLCPGHPTYVIGSPLFSRATLHLSGGKTLTITAENSSPANVYVQSMTWDGSPHTQTWIAHEQIVGGGEWGFVMGEAPRTDRPLCDEDLPYSLSREEASPGV